jgi:hypothetical protein
MAKSNVYGTQPTAAPRGRGVAHSNRGGGGGGGKKTGTPSRKLPNTPLYAGKAGQAAANQDPESFINALLANAGMTDYSGTQYGDFANEALPLSLMSAYGARGDQRQGITDYFQQQYGAGWNKTGGNKKHPQYGYSAGNLGAATGPLADQFVDYQSNVNPQEYLNVNMQRGGGIVPGGGNADFQQAVQAEFLPGVQAEWANAQRGNPTLSMDDFIAGRDLASEARNWWAMRGANRRQPGPISPAGRFSWWD